MTCIAWDGKTLAADKRAGAASRTVTKIRRSRNGALCGITGDAMSDAELFAWYDRGADPDDYPPHQRDKDKCSTLIAIEAGPVIRVFDGCAYPAVYEDRFTAVGTGRDYALAAMYLGKSAAVAVAVACAFEIHCGNGIDTLEFLT